MAERASSRELHRSARFTKARGSQGQRSGGRVGSSITNVFQQKPAVTVVITDAALFRITVRPLRAQ